MTSGRRRFLGLVLVATLIAAWFAPPVAEDDGLGLSDRVQHKASQAGHSIRPVEYQVSGAPQHSPHDAFAVLQIRPRDFESEGDEEEGLFASTRWGADQEAGAAVSEQPPTPPQAPPLPFQFLGRYEDAGQILFFLQHNDQNLVVRIGDTIAGQYKVQSLKGATLSLIYLPLNQVQSLDVGGER